MVSVRETHCPNMRDHVVFRHSGMLFNRKTVEQVVTFCMMDFKSNKIFIYLNLKAFNVNNFIS